MAVFSHCVNLLNREAARGYNFLLTMNFFYLVQLWSSISPHKFQYCLWTWSVNLLLYCWTIVKQIHPIYFDDHKIKNGIFHDKMLWSFCQPMSLFQLHAPEIKCLRFCVTFKSCHTESLKNYCYHLKRTYLCNYYWLSWITNSCS